jgi:hypothetical protein
LRRNEGGLYAQDVLMSPTNMPDGSYAGWTFTAPTGTTISAISYYRTLAAHGESNVSSGLVTAEGTVLDYCRIELPIGTRTAPAVGGSRRPAFTARVIGVGADERLTPKRSVAVT